MHLRRPFTNSSTSTKTYKLFSTSKDYHRAKIVKIQQAQEAITDYLHSTRSIPFVYAHHIAKNACFSLSSTISQIPFKHSTFLNSLQRFLRYHPINEFQFLYESIGLDCTQIKARLPVDKLFLSEDLRVFSVACVLADFGFPWNKLGLLCNEKCDVFIIEDSDLRTKLREFKDRYGFSNAVAVGICFGFPDVLSGFGERGELLSDLKKEDQVVLRVGLQEGEVGELLAMNHQVFIDCGEDDLVWKIDFFCRLGVDKEQVGLFLLLKPDILTFDLEDRVISVLSLLKHFNLSQENLKDIEQNYPYVLGRNRMVNLPHIIRAMDLSEWFFNVIKFGDHNLLATYAISNQDEDADYVYRHNLQKTLSGNSDVHTTGKLDFLHGIGFGENKFTFGMRKLYGTSSQFYERFNFLLSLGIKFSKLCKMISLSPTILNHNTYLLERKLRFLCKVMNSSLEFLDKFPSYMMYDLENRLEPRFRFQRWVEAQGLRGKKFTSFSAMIHTSENKFLALISDLHPDAPRKWLEIRQECNKFECFPSSYRSQAIQHAQEAITDYLHTTCSLPWAYAEYIGKNAPVSLSLIISQVPFHPSTFPNSLQKFLSIHPINEFEFFYESIGIDYTEIKARLPVNKLLSEDSRVFSAACALVDFGFPWNKLGMLCTEKVDVFRNEDSDLCMKLSELKDHYGVSNAAVVGICLAFPRVLDGLGESGQLLSDLKRVMLNTNLVKHIKGNVDDTYGVCRKIKLFYELGCMKGMVGELSEMNHNIFIDYAEDDLVRKIDFFCRLGVHMEQVGLLLLLKPDILKFDLEDRVISVMSLLKHFNLSEENLKQIEQNCPYVLGKNKMVNLPHIMRAMDLSEWFFNTIKSGDHSLLATYARSNQDEDEDDIYRNNFQKTLIGKYYHNAIKLDFLHGIGFGENKFTVKVVSKLTGTSSHLHERFNFLLSLGLKYSKVCKMISSSPQILNNNTYVIEKKVKFLCRGMNYSPEYLTQFPSYLLFDLENRIGPRVRFLVWLKAQGWCKKEYSVASMIHQSEKRFIATIYNIHPDAPKKWLEFEKERRKQVAEKSQSS